MASEDFEKSGVVAEYTGTSSPVAAAGDDGSNNRSTELEKIESNAETYPKGIKLVLILLSIYFSVFLVALDRTIIATALPRITDDFHSFDDIGWYNGAFTLTASAFQLFFGRMYTFYPPKWVFLTLVSIFEIGSAICGAAPNSVAFIWGRAIAGLGTAGLFNGANVLMIYAAPLHKRALYMGLIAAVFGVASVAGPLLGGVFTTDVSWRWCFYINLPIGAVTFVFLILALPATPPPQPDLPLRKKIASLDIPGTMILVPCLVCLLLALQWGGQTYPWSDGRIIALLVVFAVLLIVFVCVQAYQKETATVPPRIIKNRSVLASIWFIFFLGSAFLIPVYYLSIWFQAIKGDSAIISGVSTLPLLLGLVVSSISSGVLVMRIGYYKPFMIVSGVLIPIASGLLSLFTTTTAHPMWIGVQFFLGFAIGCGLQQSNIAVQAILPKKDLPTGISVVFFVQILGPTIFIAVAQNILDNHLVENLAGLNGLSPQDLVNIGATQLRTVFSPKDLGHVLQVYNSGLVNVFYMGTALACFAILGALVVENKSVKKAKKKPASEDKQDDNAEKRDPTEAV